MKKFLPILSSALFALTLGACAAAQDTATFSNLPAPAQSRISDAFGRDLRVPARWVRAKLSGSDSQPSNLFGFTVAVSGDTVVVASRYFGCLEGGAYVFVKPSTGWKDMTQTAKLTGSDFGPCGGSGFDEVAISGDTIVAGPGPSGAATYVFIKPKRGWENATETARLTVSWNLYGLQSLAISGDTVVVGYPNAIGNEVGALAIFVKPAGGWKDMTQQTATLTASDPGPGDQLGWAVAIDGNTVIGGAPYATVNGIQGAGAVYAFVEPPAGWGDMTQTAKLTPNYSTGGLLGECVSLTKGVALACANPATYVFVEPNGGWTDMTPTAAISSPSNQYGWSSACISGNVVGIGSDDAPYYPLNYGAVFAFLKPLGGWQNTSSPNASYFGQPSGGSQMIGYSIAVDGATLVTGAPYFSNARGIGYLFARQ